MALMTIEDQRRQMRWEQLGVDRARRAVRAALDRADEQGDTGAMAQTSLWSREIIPPLITRIEAIQKAAIEAASSEGRRHVWHDVIGLLPADLIAVIVLNTAIRAVVAPEASGGGAITSVAVALADVMREQVELEQWVGMEDAHDKDAKLDQDPGYKSLLKAFQSTYPDATRRQWARWRRRVDAARIQAWPKDKVKLAMSGELIHALVASSGGRFLVVAEFSSDGKAPLMLKVSYAGEEEVKDLKLRRELGRPRLMPMIIPPIPWTYAE